MLKPIARHSALEAPAEFRAALERWFARHGRDYPWRRTTDPYAILVSEVMLQQTQIATVLGRGFYVRFLERFPDAATLAEAGDEALLKAWEGLGYYRRARMLREAARAVVGRHGGVFPQEPAEVLALPGVGRYTAGAVLSFAFDRAAPIVDGNVARVLSRLFAHEEPIDAPGSIRWLWETADALLDRERPRTYNSALMELGQTCCRPGVPDCLACPVAACCLTRQPEILPRKAKKTAIEDIDEHVIFVQRGGGEVLLRQLGKGRREGMWRLPERETACLEGLPAVRTRRYGITRYRVTLHVHAVPADHPAAVPQAGESWHSQEMLAARVIPPADRGVLEGLLTADEEIT